VPSTPETLYDVLRVPQNASTDAVRQAFRAFVQAHHPDRAKDEADRKERTHRMVAANAAWATLRDPKARAAYDATLAAQAKAQELDELLQRSREAAARAKARADARPTDDDLLRRARKVAEQMRRATEAWERRRPPEAATWDEEYQRVYMGTLGRVRAAAMADAFDGLRAVLGPEARGLLDALMGAA
jgi:DnaJ-class molecular chaperone